MQLQPGWRSARPRQFPRRRRLNVPISRACGPTALPVLQAEHHAQEVLAREPLLPRVLVVQVPVHRLREVLLALARVHAPAVVGAVQPSR
jgi:hypothetical protein